MRNAIRFAVVITAALALGAVALAAVATKPKAPNGAAGIELKSTGYLDSPVSIYSSGNIKATITANDDGTLTLPDNKGGARCPFTMHLVDGGTAFTVDCDTSIDYNTTPAGQAFAVSPNGDVYFDTAVSGAHTMPDAGQAGVYLKTRDTAAGNNPGIGFSLATAGNTGNLTWDGTNLITDKPLSIGGGATISKPIRGTGTNPASVTAQTCADTSCSTGATGAAVGSPCSLATPAAGPGANLGATCYVSATSTVQVHICNPTAGNLTPTAGTYTCLVFNP